MANQPAAQLDPHTAPTVVPLARDHAGASIPVPEGARAWRVRRHTGGRPRLHLDARKQPMELPLTYTFADLEEILPPGLYRHDLVDAGGGDLDITVPVNLAAQRSSADAAGQSEDEPTTAISVPAGTTDVRFLLEANVRAMQLQLQHHERTLATSLRMAETLRDGVQTLAESQADCLKSLVSTRGFMRNASGAFASTTPLQLATNENAHTHTAEDPDEQDDEDEGDEPQPPNDPMWTAITAILTPVVTRIVDNMFTGRAPAPALTDGRAKPKQAFNLAALLDWRKATPKPEAPREPQLTTAELMTMVPPELLTRLMEVGQALGPDESQQLMGLLHAMPRDEFPAIVEKLRTMASEDIAAFVRTQLEGVSPC